MGARPSSADPSSVRSPPRAREDRCAEGLRAPEGRMNRRNAMAKPWKVVMAPGSASFAFAVLVRQAAGRLRAHGGGGRPTRTPPNTGSSWGGAGNGVLRPG
jgi:hypothetical protein